MSLLMLNHISPIILSFYTTTLKRYIHIYFMYIFRKLQFSSLNYNILLIYNYLQMSKNIYSQEKNPDKYLDQSAQSVFRC